MTHSPFHPILCNYYITTRCNARCTFCDIHHQPGAHALTDVVLRHIHELADTPVRFIDFTGGEPLLHPDLPLFLRRARSLGLQTTVTTNALLYPRRACELAGQIDFLHFSLDSTDAVQHDTLRGAACFDAVIESLKTAQKLGERPDILFTLTASNAHELPCMVQWARRQRVMLIINPVFSYFDNPSLEISVLTKALDYGSHPWTYLNRAIVHFMMQGGNQTERPLCRAAESTVVIGPDGCLLLPCFHHCRESLATNRSIQEMLTHPRVLFWKKMQGRMPFCRGCAISCYFDASFTLPSGRYFWESQWSKMRYVFRKTLRTRYLTAPITLK